MRKRANRCYEVGGKYEITLIDNDRYLLFYAVVSAPGSNDAPAGVIANELSENQCGRVMIVEGNKCRIAGYGGTAQISAQQNNHEVLSGRVPSMREGTIDINGDRFQVRDFGKRVEFYRAVGRCLVFFGDGCPEKDRFIVPNRLTPEDYDTIKIIDGVEYTVHGCGGEIGVSQPDLNFPLDSIDGSN